MTEAASIVPAEIGGTEITRFNALRHGALSRYTVLPWEDHGEYGDLLSALAAEHAPQGPTEEHLVEELAGIVWRKRRLRLAEAAVHRRGLDEAMEPYRRTVKVALAHLGATDPSESVTDAIHATTETTDLELREVEEDEAMTRRALDLLGSRRNDPYGAALAALREDTQDWWRQELEREPDELEEDETPATDDVEGLRRFLLEQVLPWHENRRKELANRPLIREQAFGDALKLDKLERLGRYEVHLDRKLERTLAMLIRLRDLRQGVIPG